MPSKTAENTTAEHLLPEWAKDCIYSDVQVHLDWLDRIRVLFGRVVEVRLMTDCENAPGRLQTTTTVHVPPIYQRRRKPICWVSGYDDAAPTAESEAEK